ncbi:MAG: 3-phosphoshikimate 1-carboxyvinyltransferase [Bacillota bacterium]|nr:3-phosphoshikimate 1-carboxyvinyltransferase [Bacillota bacterium]
MSAVTVHPAGRGLEGTVELPGDKSISHRAAVLAAMAEGESSIGGFSPSDDCARTLAALQAMGVRMDWQDAVLVVRGSGPAWGEPAGVIDLGNSGTSMRLLAGVLAGVAGFRVLDGDDSLRRRPMGRVVHPLREMGAHIDGRQEGNLAPLAVRGGRLTGRAFTLNVASAQVKSGLLLAGLLAAGETRVEEPLPTRDHTERMLPLAGVAVRRRGREVGLAGPARLHGFDVRVPGDPSAAAFLVVAACLVPGSRVILPGVGLNPRRTGFLGVLSRMGARIEVMGAPGAGGPARGGPGGTGPGERAAGEPAGDLEVRACGLRATEIGPEEVPSLIDELPVLAVAACAARGVTRVRGAAELRVKESDRLAAVAGELGRLGARITELPDGWIIEGPCRLRGGTVCSRGDHRLAMAWAVAGLIASDAVRVTGAEAVAVSYPRFFAHLDALGARIDTEDDGGGGHGWRG